MYLVTVHGRVETENMEIQVQCGAEIVYGGRLKGAGLLGAQTT